MRYAQNNRKAAIIVYFRWCQGFALRLNVLLLFFIILIYEYDSNLLIFYYALNMLKNLMYEAKNWFHIDHNLLITHSDLRKCLVHNINVFHLSETCPPTAQTFPFIVDANWAHLLSGNFSVKFHLSSEQSRTFI